MIDRAQDLAPPLTQPSIREWVRRNLFDGIWNTVLTVAIATLLVLVMARVGPWIARAHWGVVVDHPRFWLIGLMPVELAVRAYWAGGLIAAMVLFTLLGVRARVRPVALVSAWGGILIAVALVMSPVRLDQIGGLYLTLLLAAAAIAGSFPIGVLIGMGRVSRLPVVRGLSTLDIALIRGIPFITMLLWVSVFLTLVSGDALSKGRRGLVAMIVLPC